MNQPKPLLYSYYLSSCSWRVRIALALKGIDYTYEAVSTISKEYENINPIKYVPALKIGDDILIESMPIIEYIDEVFPGPSLLPKDPILRAKARAVASVIVSGIQPLQNAGTLHKMGEAGSSDTLGQRSEWAKYWVTTKFGELEKLLTKTAGKYCIGDDITVADICLIPQAFNASNRFGINLKQFPIISRLVSDLENIEAFQKSHPNQQPDSPLETQCPVNS